MPRIVVLMGAIVMSLAAAGRAEVAPTAAPPAPEGMEVLFNGTDLTGWDGDPRLWSVRDGVIQPSRPCGSRSRARR